MGEAEIPWEVRHPSPAESDIQEDDMGEEDDIDEYDSEGEDQFDDNGEHELKVYG